MPDKAQDDDLVMSLVDLALAMSPEERQAYVQSACGGDSQLFSQVWSYVEWEQRMNGFLLEPLHAALSEEHPFEPAELLENRFRIVREVAQGGMGIVYEAVDEKLDRRIALKCAKTGFRKRLPPEVRNASEISHPNVCKIFEIHTASTRSGEIDFLTMEFLDGVTLAERLRGGPLPKEEARTIARQLCEGLAAAHRNQVIHSDLKSNNVILTTGADGAPRAVITDFGLARRPEASLRCAQSAEAGGTPDYMAPELWKGEKASAASDVYALGVLFHAMLTGRAPARWNAPPAPQIPDSPPDASTAPLGCAVADAEWRREIEDLPAPWDRIVKRCLAPRPDQRFCSVDEVSAAFEPRHAAPKWILTLAFVLIALLAVVLWRSRENPGPPVRLAVLPIVVEGAPIQTADGTAQDVAERLSGLRGKVIVIAPDEARQNRVDTPEKAKSVLGATHVLRTNLASSGGQITAFASVIDIASGQTLRELRGVYSRSDAPAIAKALTATVTGGLHLRIGVLADVVSKTAYPFYIQGEALIRRDAIYADQAIPFFNKAIELDPQSALPYAGLAEAQLMKYTENRDPKWLDRAGEMIDKATSLNPDSARVLQVAGRFKKEHDRYEQAVQDFRRATEIEPNNSEAWRGLAAVYGVMNLPQEAAATYGRAIAAQPGYYRAYNDFGLFYWERGQNREAEDLFRRVTALAPEFAYGHNNLGLALMNQGRYAEAEEALRRALRLQESARCLTNLGLLYVWQGKFAEALPFLEKSIAVTPATAQRYSNLGDGYWFLGRTHEAAQAYRNARKMAEDDLARNPRQALPRAILGWVYAHLGEPERAAFEAAQALGMEPGAMWVMQVAALTYEELHQRDKALEALRNAPLPLLEELNRHPSAKELRQDHRFLELMAKKSIQ